jgi:hypothetical protein
MASTPDDQRRRLNGIFDEMSDIGRRELLRVAHQIAQIDRARRRQDAETPTQALRGNARAYILASRFG